MRETTARGEWGLLARSLESLNLRLPVILFPIIVFETFQNSVGGVLLMHVVDLDFAEIRLYRRRTFEQIPA